MRLIELNLTNFRQHVDTRIAFTDGLTGIIGPNGAGKSTVLEGISWALYGQNALRTNNEDVRTTTAPGGTEVRVELGFEIHSQNYTVTRTIHPTKGSTAALEVDGRVMSTGVSEVNRRVTDLLGMDYSAFFTSFFTSQKQLEFMADKDGRQRAAAISRMLGYERLSKSRDEANEERKSLDREIKGLEQGLPDPNELAARIAESEKRLKDAQAEAAMAEQSRDKLTAQLGEINPRKELLDEKCKRDDTLRRSLESIKVRLERDKKDLAAVEAELAQIARNRARLEEMKGDLERRREAGEEYKALAELQKFDSERQKILGQITSAESQSNQLAAKEKGLSDALALQAQLAASLAADEQELRRLQDEERQLRDRLVSEAASLDTRIKTENAAVADLRARRQTMADAGADGACPTCERPLAEELASVLARFDGEIEEAEKRVASLRQDQGKLESERGAAAAISEKRTKLESEIAEARKRKSEADARVSELAGVKADVVRLARQVGELRGNLAKLPSGFDQARYDELRQIGEKLRPVFEESIGLKKTLEREPDLQRSKSELSVRISESTAESLGTEKELAELGFSAEQRAEVVRKFDDLNRGLGAANVEVARAKGETKTAQEMLGQAKSDLDAFKRKETDLKDKRVMRQYLSRLSEAFDKLRADLNDRARPELEATASELLSVMTDGRYDVVEIDDSYQARIRDDGEIKPVLSGGEGDVLNLALRLAVSDMITRRAGQTSSILVLDEVFGSLDDIRRDNVLTLLQNLKNRFEQMIVITHIESIHDAVDNCIWVEFNEQTKTSRLVDRNSETCVEPILAQ